MPLAMLAVGKEEAGNTRRTTESHFGPCRLAFLLEDVSWSSPSCSLLVESNAPAGQRNELTLLRPFLRAGRLLLRLDFDLDILLSRRV